MTATIVRPAPRPAPKTFTGFTTQIDYREIVVTPELAQQWLGLNSSNRKLKPGQVKAYAEDMRAGRWRLNGELVKFSGTHEEPAKLLDGQNRLHAILRAGVPVLLGVGFGVPDNTQESMDSGVKRSVADNLTIDGAQNTVILASAATLALRINHGGITARQQFTNTTVQEFIATHRSTLAVSAAIAAAFARKADARPAIVAYTHWVLAGIDLDAATNFWRDAAEKVGLTQGDPVIALTNRLAEARRNRELLGDEAYLSIVFRAWNYRRAGKPWYIAKVNSAKGGVIEIPEPR